MRDSLSSVFIYLFMAAVFLFIVSAFGMVVIFLRAIMIDISGTEKQLGILFLYTFLTCIILAPIFLYIANKLEKYGGRINQV